MTIRVCREDLGFAVGAVVGGVIVVSTMAVVPVVRGPDLHTITAAQRSAFETGLEVYRSDVGQYPSATQGLNALVSDPGVAGWAGPYVVVDLYPYTHWFEYLVDRDGRPVIDPQRPRTLR